jgi:TetR/AcrR family transcriptional regulator, cholesterol catabolism regulator
MARERTITDDGPTTGAGTTAERLLAVAARLFRDKGYAATTTRELAEALAIQKASLYHHIKSKEDLLVEISLESLRRITDAVGAVAASKSPERRLTAMIERHVETALRDRDMHMTMLVELRSLSPERRVQVLERRDGYERLLQTVISAEQESGHLRTDVDARWLTLALLNLLNWTIFWYDPAQRQSPTDISRILSAVFLDGAGSSSVSSRPHEPPS